MPAILVTVGVALWAGAFTAFPWTSSSTGRTALAASLWLVGVLFVALSIKVQLGGREMPAESVDVNQGEGPMVLARTLINTGVIAHTVQPPASPLPTVDRRVALCNRLGTMRERGEWVNRLPHVDRVLKEAPSWQDDVFDLLDSSLTDPMQAQLFGRLGTPIPGMPLNAGLGQRVGDQVRFLSDLLDRFDSLEIKDSWHP
jgi:hypothetical protein